MTDYKCSGCGAAMVRYPNAKFGICQYCRKRFDFPAPTDTIRTTNNLNDVMTMATKYVHQRLNQYTGVEVKVDGSDLSELKNVAIYTISGRVSVITAFEKRARLTNRVITPSIHANNTFSINVRVEDLQVIGFQFGQWE